MWLSKTSSKGQLLELPQSNVPDCSRPVRRDDCEYGSLYIGYHLYHAIENTANQNTGKPLYIKQYYTQPSHYASDNGNAYALFTLTRHICKENYNDLGKNMCLKLSQGDKIINLVVSELSPCLLHVKQNKTKEMKETSK